MIRPRNPINGELYTSWEASYRHLYWGCRPDIRPGFHYRKRGLAVFKVGGYFFGLIWGKLKKGIL